MKMKIWSPSVTPVMGTGRSILGLEFCLWFCDLYFRSSYSSTWSQTSARSAAIGSFGAASSAAGFV
jgi:hypothetical protein